MEHIQEDIQNSYITAVYIVLKRKQRKSKNKPKIKIQKMI